MVLPFVLAVQFLAIELPLPLELGQSPVEVILTTADDAERNRWILGVAADPARDLVLHLDEVQAAAEPGVSWEVYVATTGQREVESAPALAGILSLFGALPEASFTLSLDAAVPEGELTGLKVIFKPISGLEIDGAPVPPVVRAPVRIGRVRLEAGPPAVTDPR